MRDERISALLTPVLAQFGLELDALEIVPAGKRRLLRVVVDGDGPGGRGPLLDDIAEASRALSDALDASDATGSSAYTLEVSSRGVGRPLQLPRHWRRNLTRLVAVTLTGGEQLTGRVATVDEDAAVLDVDGVVRTVAYADVVKALVQVELNRPKGLDTEPVEDEDGPDEDSADEDRAGEDQPGDDEDGDLDEPVEDEEGH